MVHFAQDDHKKQSKKGEISWNEIEDEYKQLKSEVAAIKKRSKYSSVVLGYISALVCKGLSLQLLIIMSPLTSLFFFFIQKFFTIKKAFF